MLFEESGIEPEVAAERGYRTTRSRSELVEFKTYQRRAGLVVPIYSPDGITRSAQLRPDTPRKDRKGKPLKYETPGGSRVILDVHPRMREEVRSGGGDLWITEGIKKADALTSRGLATVGLIGVWNWQRDGEMLPDWDHVALQDRRAYVVYDSDVMVKEGVQLALERLVKALEGRGADVLVVYLPDGEGGEKVGADDYLVASGTVAELQILARRFESQDLGRIRLSRDERLREAVEDLGNRWWREEWKGMGGRSDYDVASRLVEAAGRRGKLVEGGVRVEVSWGTLQLESGVSRRTLSKAIRRLEVRGFCWRDNEGREDGKPGAFVLRASVDHYGRGSAGERESNARVTSVSSPGIHLRASLHSHIAARGDVGEKVRVLPMPDGSFPRGTGVLRLSAPRLRWSSPARKPLLGTVEGTRKVRQGQREKPRPAVKRLGKTRGAVLDALEDLGGVATLGELAATLRHKRPRDLRRRLLSMLEETGILTVEDDLLTLADNWLEALDVARELGGELKAHKAATEDLKRKRKAYHGRHRVRLDHHPANAEGGPADGWSEELRPEDPALPGCAPEASERDEAPVSGLAAAVGGYLELNPGDACQRPSWIGLTLWAVELVDGKPSASEVGAAIEELGGDSYLRLLLGRAREAGAA
jgi:DNA-binding transcriptional ArsR family regulator